MNRRLFLSALSTAPLILVPEVPDVRRVYSFVGGWAERDPILEAWGHVLRVHRMPGETDEGMRGRLRDKLAETERLSHDRFLYGLSAHYEDSWGNIVRVKPSAVKHHQFGWMTL